MTRICGPGLCRCDDKGKAPMLDRLDAIEAALLNAPRLPAIDQGDVAWLVDEVRRLRQRHAEAVEAAFFAGFHSANWPDTDSDDANAAWLASEARKGVAHDNR